MDSIKKDILRLLRQKTGNGSAPPPTTSNENDENPTNFNSEVLNPGETYVEAPVCPSCSQSPIILPNPGMNLNIFLKILATFFPLNTILSKSDNL